jgi:hypothetical protein
LKIASPSPASDSDMIEKVLGMLKIPARLRSTVSNVVKRLNVEQSPFAIGFGPCYRRSIVSAFIR